MMIDTIQALFETDSHADAHSEQLQLCYQLLKELNQKTVWGDLAPAMIEQFVELLTECMNHRVLSLNEEDKSNITPLSLLAAQLYAKCLGLPGALHLVEMEAISALGIVLRKSKIDNSSSSTSRKRKINEFSHYESSIHSSLVELNVEEPVGVEDVAQWSNGMLLEMMGVCHNPEFHSWSDDARASLIDSMIQSVTIAAAFQQQSIGDEPVEALLACLLTDETFDSRVLSQRHESLVAILRSTFPVLTMKEIVPNGEGGKTNACKAVAKILQNLVRLLTKDIGTHPDRWPHSLTLNLGRRKSVLQASPVTPRKPRQSLEATPLTPAITTPKLKGSAAKSVASTTPPRSYRPRPVISAILGLVQKLATHQALNRATLRDIVVSMIHSCVSYLPINERSHILTFWIQLCHSKVPLHRLVGCELVGLALAEVWLWSDHVSNPVTQDRRKSLSPLVAKSSTDMPAALFGALQGRLMDRAPAVRASSASAFAKMIRTIRQEDQNIASRGLIEAFAEEGESLVRIFRDRIKNDEKATVRRTIVSALAELMVLGEQHSTLSLYLSDSDLKVISDLCNDDATLTRKAAAESLTLLLEEVSSLHLKKSLRAVEQQWTAAVLPLVLDSETSCGSKAIELVSRLILRPIIEKTSIEDTAWRMLADIASSSGRVGASRREGEAIRTAVSKFIETSNNSRDTLKSLLNVIHEEALRSIDSSADDAFSHMSCARRAGVWCLFCALLEEPSHSKVINDIIKRSKLDFDFVASAWEQLLDMMKSADEENAARIRSSVKMSLHVLSLLSKCVNDEMAKVSSKNLRSMLSNFSIPVEVSGVAIKALMSVIVSHSVEDFTVHCSTCISDILGSCEALLLSSASSSITERQGEKITRAIHTVGELSMVGFSLTDDSAKSSEAIKVGDNSIDLLKGMHVKVSAQLMEMVLLYVADSLPDGSKIPENVRAHSYVTLGKLCLRDGNLAKRSLNLFARELHENMKGGSPVIQSNVLLVLGDLCVRYTNLVDRFLPIMAACLQSGITDISKNIMSATPKPQSAVVRKHSVLLLSNLLLQDYIKWRGLLYHRFLVAAADEDEDVADMASAMLCGALLTKQPRLFSNNFVESLFVLNRCTAHPIYQTAAALGDGGSGISVGFDGINLSGSVGRIRRLRMYEIMLCRMTDEEKIGITARIAKEVFKSALDPSSDLHIVCSNARDEDDEELSEAHESALNVLSDAFAVLASPHMKVGKAATREEDEIEDPTLPNTTRRVVVAKGRLLSNISRKHLIETIIPILCKLKNLLQKSQSPLLKSLMTFLVDVFRKYKEEVREFLANDPNLLQELEYDAKQFQKANATPSRRRKSLSQATPMVSATA